MISEKLFDVFPVAPSLRTPKLESSSPISQFRIEVQASIQEHVFGTSSGQLSCMCCGLLVCPLLGSPPTVWKPETCSSVLQPGGQAVFPHLEAQSPSVSFDHSSSGVVFLPGYFILRCWPLGNLYMIQIFVAVFFLMFRMKQAMAKRYGIVAEFILSIKSKPILF